MGTGLKIVQKREWKGLVHQRSEKFGGDEKPGISV